jgi:hypothetical protein
VEVTKSVATFSLTVLETNKDEPLNARKRRYVTYVTTSAKPFIPRMQEVGQVRQTSTSSALCSMGALEYPT